MIQQLYIDAGVLVNLCASGRTEEILEAQSCPIVILTQTGAEPLIFFGDSSNEGLTLKEFIATFSLTIQEQELAAPVDEALFIEFALTVRHDQTASFLTMIANTQSALATDDQCKTNALAQVSPTITVLTTAQLLLVWQQQRNIPPDTVAKVLLAIEDRAQFTPLDATQAEKWWNAILREVREAE